MINQLIKRIKKKEKLSINKIYKNNVNRKRFIAKVKNVCIVIPFDGKESLLSFKKDILLNYKHHIFHF